MLPVIAGAALPVARWAMDDNASNPVVSESAAAKDGTFSDATDSNTSYHHTADCQEGSGALNFDGIDDYVEVIGYKGITGTASRTCTAWIKTFKAPGDIIAWGTNYGNGQKWLVRVSDTGTLRTEVYGGYILGATRIDDGNWHHIAVVLDNDGSPDISEVQLYVDGFLDNTSEVVAQPINTADTQDLSMGVYTLLNNRHFQGLLDDVRIYDYALSSEEVYHVSNPEVAWQPYPADAAQGVGLVSELNWSAGDSALSHDVYFGTSQSAVANARRFAGDVNGDRFVNILDLVILGDQWLMNPGGVNISGDISYNKKVDMEDLAVMAGTWQQTPDVSFMGNQTSSVFNPPALKTGADYYWRVDEVNPSHPESPRIGRLWNFCTYLVDWVDRDRFPEAYSILTSDHIMYPDNVTGWPMKIDSKRQLFVDYDLVGSMTYLTREFHQPIKFEINPLSTVSGVPVAVVYDSSSGLFKMWYDLSYAQSNDGVHWTLPDLGNGNNRIIDEDGQIKGFMYNPDIPEQEGRYKLVLEKQPDEAANEPGGFYLYYSFDGLNWQQQLQRPILQQNKNHMISYTPEAKAVADNHTFQWTYPTRFQSVNFGDTTVFQYDPILKTYTCSAQFDLYMPQEKFDELGIVSDGKPRLQLRTFMESDDIVHWSSPRMLIYPDKYDDPDCQIYDHVGFPYESFWAGMVGIMHLSPTGSKQIDLELTYSRDGRHWMRPRERVPFIALGSAGSWDSGRLGYTKSPPILVGDELWFYYYGCNDQADAGPYSIGLAKLRRDGFASLNADFTPGTLITRPLTFMGTKLFVNADVEEYGYIKAAVLTKNRDSIPSYTLQDSIPLSEDTVKGQMVWNTTQELALSGFDNVRIIFEMRFAKLYSFWIE